VPYLLMTCINLLANILVGSYAQIVVLPMKAARIPQPNQVLIASREGEIGSRVISLIPKQSSATAGSLSRPSNKNEKENSKVHVGYEGSW
jgi:hypothetical protein